MNKEVDVELLHNKLLTMAKFFHKTCIENNIQYYMLGGTMLGAVRHEGFIPWDDDMDFGIPRKDYNRFLELAEGFFESGYEIRYYQNTDNSPMHYAKLIDSRTTLIENHYHNYIEGLYIDVFPLDGANVATIGDIIRNKRILILQALIMSHCTTTKKKGLVRKTFKKYAEICNLDRLHSSLEKIMTAKEYANTMYLANFLGAWAEKETISKEIMGNPTLYKFEDAFFYGAEDYDGYLKSLYGDYMQLPPEGKRVFKHNFYYLDFETSYRDYIERIR